MPNRKLVVVVDDDAGMRRSVARLLRQFGYASLAFSSAEAFRNHGDFGNAACIILDINLGDGSGIDLGLHLKAAGSSIPVIYITGNETPAVRSDAQASGCIAFITKPFSAQELMVPLQSAAARFA